MAVQEKRLINIGLIGSGNVGMGVARFFHEGRGEAHNIHLKRVAVANPAKPREIELPNLTGDVKDILNDPAIDIVVEVMGGTGIAREVMFDALARNKAVVTANKAVLARDMRELFDASRGEQVDIGYEGAVAGGIPVIRVVNTLGKVDSVQRITGIVNGTTNFMLTRMEEGMDFNQAVALAQELGFAEADHSLDTGGFDAADKLAILASLVFNAHIDPGKIGIEGITEISPIDIAFAKEYRLRKDGPAHVVKLLAVANNVNGQLELHVGPALINRDHPLAGVRNEVNAVSIDWEHAGPMTLTGKGAGQNPTASAVLTNVVEIAENRRNEVYDEPPKLDSNIIFADSDNVPTRGYIRVDLTDEVGSALGVFEVFAANSVSVGNSEQQEVFAYGKDGVTVVPDINTIKPAPLGRIKQGVSQLAHLPQVHGAPFFMRIEE